MNSNEKFEKMASLKYELRTIRSVAVHNDEGMSEGHKKRMAIATAELADLNASLTDAEFVAYIEWTKTHAI
jgi:hypothetical protein